MKTFQLQVHSGRLCNRVATGDKHDASVEFWLRHSSEEAFLITKAGSKLMCYAGSLVKEEAEQPEAPKPEAAPKPKAAKGKGKSGKK